MVNTACASSLTAFDLAVTDLRLGKCDQAIVGSTQLNLVPLTNFIFQNNHLNSQDGMARVWDKDADGFVRAETIASVLLQRKSQAKRIYATVIHSKNNTDGYKKMGNFFPSTQVQQKLMEETCIEAGIDPNQVNYFEAHGTATKAGDSVEAEAIYNAYCKDRKGELLIGLLKSNIGHGEGTSGIASVCKTVISFENKCIAANLNLKEIKPKVAEFCPPLKPVTENTPFEPKLAGINNFGLGGVNAHVILEANNKEVNQESFLIVDKIPRLVNVCGRTQEGLDHLFNFIKNNPVKITRDFLALLGDVFKWTPQINTSGFPYRGSIIIKKNQQDQFEYITESSLLIGMKKPIWLFFSGMGSQWTGMAKAMMVFDKFAQSINKCAMTLKQFKIDLFDILLSEDKNALESITTPFVAITSFQIALFDLLTELEIYPEGIIGHSFGEIACAYADGCLTLEQAIQCSYWRGKVVEDSNIPSGMMAAIGLSWEEAKKRCPKNVFVACDNAEDSVTISGLEDDTKDFIEKLKSEGVFVREVIGFGLKPYHSKCLDPVADILTKHLKKIITEPKPRSDKWYSTSIPKAKWSETLAKTASAEYFVNNLVKPVLLKSTLRNAPEDTIVIEVAPHSLFQSLIKRTLPAANYVGLLKRNDNQHNLENFLSALGKVYQLGINPSIEKLYPKVEWPVGRGTQSISSLMKWDHKESYFVKKYPEYHFPATASDMTFEFSLDIADEQFLKDHCIEGRVIFPATGYLMLAWRRLAGQKGQQWNKFPVVFENVQLRRPVLFEKGKVKLTVRYLEPTGEFVILDNGNVTAFGRITIPEEGKELQLQHLVEDTDESQDDNEYVLSGKEFYKELKSRGFDYGPKFQNVIQSKFIDLYNVKGKVKYSNNTNIISFLDSVFQLLLGVIPIRGLFIPVAINSLRCDPRVLFKAIDKNKKEVINEEQTNDEKKYEDKVAFMYHLTNDEKTITEKKDIPNEIAHCKTDIEKVYADFQEQTGAERKEKWISHVPVQVDINVRAIVASGIEVRGFVPVNIQRKQTTNGLRLEKYHFIPYFEKGAIEKPYRNQLQTYMKVCQQIGLEIAKKLQIQSDKIKLIIQSETGTEFDEKFIQKITTNIRDDETFLKLLNEFKQIIENKNIIEKEHFGSLNLINDLKQRIKASEFDLEKDLINLIGRNERLIRPLLDTVNENSTPIKELKVVEINLTSGLICVDVGQMQVETFIVQTCLDYTIAHKDIETIRNIEEVKKNNYKLVQWDHLASAFPQNIPSEVNLLLHRDSTQLWNVDLNQYMKSAFNTVKNNGFMLAIFRTKITNPEIIINEIIKSENFLLDEELLSKRVDQFENAAIENGFKIVSKKTDSMMYTATLFRKINNNIKPDGQSIVEIKTGKYNEWIEMVKDKINEYKGKFEDENVWLIANDTDINGILGLMQSLRLESGGGKLRCIFDVENKLGQIDFNKSPFKEILENDLVMNVFRNGFIGSMKHLNLTKDDEQTQVEEAYVNVIHRGDLSSLQWFNGHKLYVPTVIPDELENQIEMVKCDVYYSSLNFKDVMTATGRMHAGPEGAIVDCLIGFEFAGRRCDTGERVFGMALSFGIATSIITKSPLIFKVPERWSLKDAATIFTVYMTVWYGIIKRGKLKRGESILIHSGSGGVGQAAIIVCQYYECKIFTTVGTQEKRDFLKKTYGLTDDEIFSSRDTDFEEKVMTATKGKGVNLVLNSLSQEKLLASFRCVSDEGRFIEIGKYDLQFNNSLPMFQFLRNISFHGIGLDKISLLENENHIEIYKKFKNWISNGIQKGYVKPIVRTVFGKEDVKEAFKHMMSGKHIGKVLIKIRDEEEGIGNVIAPKIKITALAKTWFDPEKVYIIIGGLGGMGMEMIYWMMLRGAKKIIATSRTGIKNNSQKLFFKQLEELGKIIKIFRVNIKIFYENVIYEEQAKELIRKSEEMGQIGGIFQLALVLHDALLENQTVDTFTMVCDSKVNGTIHLDKLSRQLDYRLDYFVCFSSLACGRGNTGQSNYGYANSVMERICENRRKDGLHGLAIQWGPIGDVGIVTNSFNEDTIKKVHLLFQRSPSWLYALDKFLQCQYPVVASVIRMDKRLSGGSRDDNVIKQLWAALGIDPKNVPNYVTLGELGMESFVAIELQQRLERDYNINLTLNQIKKITVGDLKEFEDGNLEKVKTYARDIKEAKLKISKIKFEIPNEPLTKLNSATEGTPAYFLPPVEGLFDNLIPLIQLLPFPVYSLNWTQEMESLKSIKQIALYYMKLMKNVEPKGKYNLLSFSFGSFVGLKMCYKKAPVNKLIIIDAFSFDKLKNDLESWENETNEEKEFEQVLRFINRNVPKSFHERIKNDLKRIKGEEAKTKKLIESIYDIADKSINGKNMEKIIRGMLERAKIINKFNKKMFDRIKEAKKGGIVSKIAREKLAKQKIDSLVVIIKSTDNPEDLPLIEQEIMDTFGFQKEVCILFNLQLKTKIYIFFRNSKVNIILKL